MKDIREIWEKIYNDYFGLEKNFSSLEVPVEYDPAKHFGIIVSEITMNEIFEGMSKKLRLDVYKRDLNGEVRGRIEKQYFIFFKKNIEADEDLLYIPAFVLKNIRHNGITLRERMLLEILSLETEGKHLDRERVTLCSGSRYYNGLVPTMYEEKGEIIISWRRSNVSLFHVASRSVQGFKRF